MAAWALFCVSLYAFELLRVADPDVDGVFRFQPVAEVELAQRSRELRAVGFVVFVEVERGAVPHVYRYYFIVGLALERYRIAAVAVPVQEGVQRVRAVLVVFARVGLRDVRDVEQGFAVGFERDVPVHAAYIGIDLDASLFARHGEITARRYASRAEVAVEDLRVALRVDGNTAVLLSFYS